MDTAIVTLVGVAVIGGASLPFVTAICLRWENHARLRWECDQQHAWTLKGDPRGTYGTYRPEIED
jgi:hypothetical protein